MRMIAVLLFGVIVTAADAPKRLGLTGLGWETLDEVSQGTYVMGWEDGLHSRRCPFRIGVSERGSQLQ
jgi:hypothetical protein